MRIRLMHALPYLAVDVLLAGLACACMGHMVMPSHLRVHPHRAHSPAKFTQLDARLSTSQLDSCF